MFGEWYEVWIDDSAPYLLVVTPDANDLSRILVLDPAEKYATVHHDNDYEAVKLWLLEDEYYMVRGRVLVGEI